MTTDTTQPFNQKNESSTTLCQVTQSNGIPQSEIVAGIESVGGSSKHQEVNYRYNDYICNRGTGERMGFLRQQNDLDKIRSVNLNSFFVNKNKTLPIPTTPRSHKVLRSGNGVAYRQRVLTMEVPTWRERIPRSDSAVEVANVKVYTLHYATLRYYTRCRSFCAAVRGHFFVPISI
jgi:hypothetical protein